VNTVRSPFPNRPEQSTARSSRCAADRTSARR
jgi:hypothetical protein